MKQFLLTALISAAIAAAEVPLNQEVVRGDYKIKAVSVDQLPLSNPEYTGGPGLFVYVGTTRWLPDIETFDVTVSVRLRDGRSVTRTQSVPRRALLWQTFYFKVGAVETVSAVSIQATAFPTTTDF